MAYVVTIDLFHEILLLTVILPIKKGYFYTNKSRIIMKATDYT